MANITEKLADTVPDRGVKIAYGEKVVVGGTEMVPVAFVSYGFGGGTMDGKGNMGPDKDADMTGDGAGGAGSRSRSAPTSAARTDCGSTRIRSRARGSRSR